MKKVLHVWQALYPWDVRVAKINRTLRDQGFEVTTLARRGKDQPLEAEFEGTPIRRIARSPSLSVPVPGNLFWDQFVLEQARATQAELLLVRDLPLSVAALRAGRKLGIPVILDMAEHYPEAMRTWKKYSRHWLTRLAVHDLRIPDWIEKKTLPHFDGIWVVCEEQRERLIHSYGISPERIEVILNTPELTVWKDFPKGAAHPKPFRFGYHGILCEDRELETLLVGFNLAAQKDSEIELWLAGGGESEESLRALASTLPHASRIRFTGRYRPEEQKSLYAETDFGVVSWRKNAFSENTLANKFFEYPAMGKPFIYTELAPIQRLMPQLNCGVGFHSRNPESVAQAMLGIRQQSYDILSRNGMKAIAEQFHWGQDTTRMLTFLKKMEHAR